MLVALYSTMSAVKKARKRAYSKLASRVIVYIQKNIDEATRILLHIYMM